MWQRSKIDCGLNREASRTAPGHARNDDCRCHSSLERGSWSRGRSRSKRRSRRWDYSGAAVLRLANSSHCGSIQWFVACGLRLNLSTFCRAHWARQSLLLMDGGGWGELRRRRRQRRVAEAAAEILQNESKVFKIVSSFEFVRSLRKTFWPK